MFSPLKTLSMIYLKKRPFLLNHKINIACDCRCKFCDSWRIKEDPQALMSPDEIRALLDRAAALGMLSYSAWGGEPLLREDLPRVMAHARRRGFFTTISTNASLLSDRARELAPHTSHFIVSLDGTGDTHDKVRGFPGLFERVVAGIEELRKLGGVRVRLFYNVNKDTGEDVAEAARLAGGLGVSIFFYPVVRFPGYNDALVLEREQEREIFSRIKGLKRAGYPVLNLSSYLEVVEKGKSVRCRFPAYHIYVDYDGELYTCDLGPNRKLARWGDCRTVDLGALFASRAFRDKAAELSACNACRLSCGEIGFGSPLLQFPARAWVRLRYERRLAPPSAD